MVLPMSSIFEATPPRRRCQRQLSQTKVGLAGNSPAYANIPDISLTREVRCRSVIDSDVNGEDVRTLWKHYMDVDEKPLNNRDLQKVGRRLKVLLVSDLAEAISTGDKEAIKEAVAAADGKLQILSLGGLAQLKKAKKAIGMDTHTLPDPDQIAGPWEADAGTRNLDTTAELEDGQDDEEEGDYDDEEEF